jgi:hypothetical protein
MLPDSRLDQPPTIRVLSDVFGVSGPLMLEALLKR